MRDVSAEAQRLGMYDERAARWKRAAKAYRGIAMDWEHIARLEKRNRLGLGAASPDPCESCKQYLPLPGRTHLVDDEGEVHRCWPAAESRVRDDVDTVLRRHLGDCWNHLWGSELEELGKDIERLVLRPGSASPVLGECERCDDHHWCFPQDEGGCQSTFTDRGNQHETSRCDMIEGHKGSHYDQRTGAEWTDEHHHNGPHGRGPSTAPTVDASPVLRECEGCGFHRRRAEEAATALRRCVDARDSDEGETEACEVARAWLEVYPRDAVVAAARVLRRANEERGPGAPRPDIAWRDLLRALDGVTSPAKEKP